MPELLEDLEGGLSRDSRSEEVKIVDEIREFWEVGGDRLEKLLKHSKTSAFHK